MRRANGSNLSRRAVLFRGALLGGAAVGLAGCRKRVARPAAPNPDANAMSAAVATELRLLQMYDAAIAADRFGAGWLPAGRDAHKAHLAALTTTPQPIASTPPEASLVAQQGALVAAERNSAAALRTAAVALQDGDRAALLASIAAAHEAHATLHPVIAAR
jgi:hypothetical protein